MTNDMKKYAKLVIIVLFIMIIVFLIFYETGLFVKFTNENINSSEMNNFLQHTENIISFSTFIISVFSILITGLGILAYHQYHKTSEIRNEAEELLERKKNELKNITYEQINYHFHFFTSILKDLIKTHRTLIASIDINKDMKTNVILMQNLAGLSDQLVGIDDTFENIRKLMSVDPDKARSALYNLIGKKNPKYSLFINQFVDLRKNDSDFKELTKIAVKGLESMNN